MWREQSQTQLPGARGQVAQMSPTASSDHQGTLLHWQGSSGMGCPGRCWSHQPLRCPKPPGQGPVQPALGGPAGAEGWVMTS